MTDEGHSKHQQCVLGCFTCTLGTWAFCIAKGLPSAAPKLPPRVVSSHPGCLGNVPQSSWGSIFPLFFSCCWSHAVILLLSCCYSNDLAPASPWECSQQVLMGSDCHQRGNHPSFPSFPTFLLLFYISGGTKLINYPACDTHNISDFNNIWVGPKNNYIIAMVKALQGSLERSPGEDAFWGHSPCFF